MNALAYSVFAFLLVQLGKSFRRADRHLITQNATSPSYDFRFRVAACAQQRAGQNAQQLCRNNKNGVFPHEEYCDYYYECDSATGEAFVSACPNGLAFAGAKRGLTSNCDYPHRVGCPDGTRVMGRKCALSSVTFDL